MESTARSKCVSIWQQQTFMNSALYPFSLLYRAVFYLRKLCYQKKLFKVHQFSVPVIVVGNITVGGTGKTPLVIWLVNFLKSQGYKPGIVSRGYKAKTKKIPLAVNANTDPLLAGDEPVLIAARTDCPMVIDPLRGRAVEYLLKNFSCDIVISDDGLQHYALHRDIEIVLIHGKTLFGNGYCLPAGPLREPLMRLKTADFIVANHKPYKNAYNMRYRMVDIVNLSNEQQTLAIKDLTRQKIHAVAGIGHPEQFFQMLEEHLQLPIIRHTFADHYLFKATDFSGFKDEIIIMTEKDAVKCKAFSQNNFYYVRIDADLDVGFAQALMNKLKF